MKICLLAKASSPHTQNLAKFLVTQGHQVHILSFVPGDIDGVEVENLKPPHLPFKIGYLTLIIRVRKIINTITPDVVNTHFASSYGLLGVLSGFHPLVITTWGSDIFEFPKRSLLHKILLSYTLNKADLLVSTSNYMGKEVEKYTSKKDIRIIPLGVDTTLFKPDKKTQYLTLGCTKDFEEVYDHETLIRAFKIVLGDVTEAKLYLIGDGKAKENLLSLTKKLEINKNVIFLGRLGQKTLVKKLQSLNMVVLPSRRESLGVSALEASACGVPVIASDIPGLKESVVENTNGIFFETGDSNDLARKILYLHNNKRFADELGKKGREFVKENFEQRYLYQKLVNSYNEVLIGS